VKLGAVVQGQVRQFVIVHVIYDLMKYHRNSTGTAYAMREATSNISVMLFLKIVAELTVVHRSCRSSQWYYLPSCFLWTLYLDGRAQTKLENEFFESRQSTQVAISNFGKVQGEIMSHTSQNPNEVIICFVSCPSSE